MFNSRLINNPFNSCKISTLDIGKGGKMVAVQGMMASRASVVSKSSTISEGSVTNKQNEERMDTAVEKPSSVHRRSDLMSYR